MSTSSACSSKWFHKKEADEKKTQTQNAVSSSLDGKPTPQLQNVVATFKVGRRVDLKKIVLKARNAEYNSKRFNACILRITKPVRATGLVFSTGKVVCTGASDDKKAKDACNKLFKIIKKIIEDENKEFRKNNLESSEPLPRDEVLKFQDFKVQNVVASCSFDFPIRLKGISEAHSKFCDYEPELFRGLIYRMKDPAVVLLIFDSGKIVLTGAKSRDDIQKAMDMIFPLLKSFKKQ